MVMYVYSKVSLALLFLIIACSQAQNIEQGYLAPHNVARKMVGIAPLVWDGTIAAYAQNYANQRHDCKLQHSDGPYGENIFWGSNNGFTAEQAVGFWVDEKQWYHYDSNSCDDGQMCGHYTQVVWRDSVKIGCATASCDNGGVFITCNYDPPGNYIGERPY